MVIAYLENEEIARACAREYFRFHSELIRSGITLTEYAAMVDRGINPDTTLEINRAYLRLKKKAEKKKKIKLDLTIQGTYDKDETRSWMSRRVTFKDLNGKNIPKESMAKPIWKTELQLAPQLRKEGVKVVVKY